MKKLFLIFIMIAGFGIFITQTTATVKKATTELSVTTAEDFSAPVLEDKEKDKKKAEETKASSIAEAHVVPANSSTETQVTGCSEAQKQSCAAAQKSCCAEKKND